MFGRGAGCGQTLRQRPQRRLCLSRQRWPQVCEQGLQGAQTEGEEGGRGNLRKPKGHAPEEALQEEACTDTHTLPATLTLTYALAHRNSR